MWTITMLFFCKIIYSTGVLFQGGLFLWSLGIPLVIFLLILSSNDKKQFLSANTENLQSGYDIEVQMRYYLRLVSQKNNDLDSCIMIKGFIRRHEEECYVNDCPIKNIFKLLDFNVAKNNLEFFRKNNTIHQNLLSYANKVFTNGLIKFPECISLRISYALFLFHHQKQRIKAKKELEKAETQNPSFDLQFIIFRYKKLIHEERESKHESEVTTDAVSLVAFEFHFLKYQMNIVKAARFFLEFWDTLGQSNREPDLISLNKIRWDII